MFLEREELRHDGRVAGGGRGRGGSGGAAGPAGGEASLGRPHRSGEVPLGRWGGGGGGRGGGGFVVHLERNKMDYRFEITTVQGTIGLHTFRYFTSCHVSQLKWS